MHQAGEADTSAVVRDVPWNNWIGSLFSMAAVTAFFWLNDYPVVAIVLDAIILIRLAGSSILTIRADHAFGELVLTYRYLFWQRRVICRMGEIAAVDLERSGRKSGGYRVVLIKQGGEAVPLRSGYANHWGQNDLCRRVRALIGMGPPIASSLRRAGDGQAGTDDARRTDAERHATIAQILAVAGRLSIGLGICLLLGCGAAVWRTYAFEQSAVRTAATVTRLDRVEVPGRKGAAPSIQYAPRLRFTDARGQTHEVRDTTTYSESDLKIGDQVFVLYDPANPRIATLDRRTSIWGGTVCFGIFLSGAGLLALSAGAAVLRLARRIQDALIESTLRPE